MRNLESVQPRILVIDDIYANLKAMRVLLKGVAAEVVTADSGNIGLAKALEGRTSLILLDVNMPEMDGFEVAKLLGEMEETENIPIIFITAYQQDEDKRLRGYSSGAVDFIQKPLNPDILLSKVHIFLKIWNLRFGLEEEIRRRREVQKEILHLAQHDTLTLLPNRRHLHVEIQNFIDRISSKSDKRNYDKRSDDKFAVLFLDLDGFKKINDELGHEAGDFFLKDIAMRFRKQIRSVDFIARYGGDEFIILLADLRDTLSLTTCLKYLSEEAQQPINWEGTSIKAGVSIGVSIYPEHGEDGDSLIKSADTALHLAKEAGRNTFRFYTDDLNNSMQRKLLLERHIRTALENNEFQVHYQPIVDTSNGKAIAAEALLRWNSPELGMVSPVEFISIAEDAGLIIELGIWTLRESARVMRNCSELSIAVNASTLQFNNDLLCNELERLIDSKELDPSRTTIEITEGLLLNNAEEVDSRLEKIRAMGVDLSIDDFGTGYSALGYLKRCPVNKLKIDRSFVMGIPEDVESVALVKAIIAMAKALNLQVIAEGVETEEQWDFLRGYDCDMSQGYFFSRPLSEQRFLSYLENAETAQLN